ncbi:ComF family protein [Candidatus Saccharibacteria bacterium]|nr:ComF family protein [Candidatus Saccharibacteria bacterium]
MLLIERIIGLYAPHFCLGCEAECDALLCDNCRATLPVVPSRCYRCHAVTRDYSVCRQCKPYTPLRHVYVGVHYDGLAKELLHRTKYERARAGITTMVAQMSHLFSRLPGRALLVPVPTATRRVRQRGYDQAELLANELSSHTSLPVTRALARLGQEHQVGSGRTERLAHLKNAFRSKSAKQISGAHALLVDDVLTTGATLETAARCLRKAGARHIDAIVFSQAA